eukprot:COSAG02_NODE_577_length_20095_cov_6.816413_9_plen_78_part_00
MMLSPKGMMRTGGLPCAVASRSNVSVAATARVCIASKGDRSTSANGPAGATPAQTRRQGAPPSQQRSGLRMHVPRLK